MNQVLITGRLSKDPEIRYTSGAKAMAVAKFTVAVDRGKDKDKNDKGADFVPCTAFSGIAEFMEKYGFKGQQVMVVGRYHTDSYEKEGKKIYTTDVLVDKLELFSYKSEKKIAEDKEIKNTNEEINDMIPEGFETLDGDIPF